MGVRGDGRGDEEVGELDEGMGLLGNEGPPGAAAEVGAKYKEWKEEGL